MYHVCSSRAEREIRVTLLLYVHRFVTVDLLSMIVIRGPSKCHHPIHPHCRNRWLVRTVRTVQNTARGDTIQRTRRETALACWVRRQGEQLSYVELPSRRPELAPRSRPMMIHSRTPMTHKFSRSQRGIAATLEQIMIAGSCSIGRQQHQLLNI
jgi:hypothetical protein